MKIVRAIVAVLTVPLLIWLAISLLFSIAFVGPLMEPLVRHEFTAEQRDAIYGLLSLEPLPDEQFSTSLWPGFGQGKGSLTVTFYNVTSQEDFLARLHTPTQSIHLVSRRYHILSEIHVIPSEGRHTLTFSEDYARMFISGEFRTLELTSVFNFLYEDRPPHTFQWYMVLNPHILTQVGILLAFAAFLIFTSPKRRKGVTP